MGSPLSVSYSEGGSSGSGNMTNAEPRREFRGSTTQSPRWSKGLVATRLTYIGRRLRRLTFLSYVVASILPLAAFGLEYWLEPLTGHTSYQLFLGAVALSAIYGGIGSGLCTLAISGFLKFYFFLAPQAADQRAALTRLALFFLLGFMVAWLAGKLRGTQQNLHATLNFIGDAVAITNSKKQILFLNPMAEILTEWSCKEAKGKLFSDVVSLIREDTGQPADDPIERAFEEGTAVGLRVPMLLRSRNGSTTAVEDSVAPIRDAAGTITGSVVVLRDVSERRALESRLRTAQKIQALTRLTAPVAHDFNNLLTVLGGHAELLRTRLATLDDQTLMECAEEILKATDHAGRLARQLMVFNGGPVTRRSRVDVNQVLARMEKALGLILGDYISLYKRLEPDLWPVKATPEQIEQIVINLAANARDAMPMGGSLIIRTRNVQVAGEAVGDERRPYIMLEVRDDGCGMDDETKSRIFEPFFSTKPNHEGAGLGLSVVYSIVVQSGGRVTVSSEPGEGTSFQIYLPRFVEDSNVTDPGSGAALGTTRLKPAPAVLVVDSEDGVRRMVASALRAGDYAVLEAGDGREALELASKNINHLDLIVAELATPEVTGPEIAARLALLRPDIKVLYISSSPKPSGWDENGSQPNRAFLFKPFSPGELLAKVSFLLSVNPSVQ